MVDASTLVGKNPDTTARWLAVVAAAIQGKDGRWLMYHRPTGKHHGGLWEFPGGKVEDIEIPVESLVRELGEELGISVRPEDCEPIAFADNATDETDRPIVILLYKIARFAGEPAALEGGAVRWFTPYEIHQLSMPPLDVALAAQIFEAR